MGNKSDVVCRRFIFLGIQYYIKKHVVQSWRKNGGKYDVINSKFIVLIVIIRNKIAISLRIQYIWEILQFICYLREEYTIRMLLLLAVNFYIF